MSTIYMRYMRSREDPKNEAEKKGRERWELQGKKRRGRKEGRWREGERKGKKVGSIYLFYLHQTSYQVWPAFL